MMQQEDLLIYKSDVHSQNGEDGIIAAIFERIGTTSKICCEFGAWDGIYLSNCRKLILEGWRALMIEGDPRRFDDLIRNYKDNPSVICVNRFVDTGPNSLDSILRANRMDNLDFLSIDIDGLDYEIFDSLEVCPRVICIEVNAGHDPSVESPLGRERAKKLVGQPMQVFVEIADKKGYDFVCYSGNAFFVHRSARTKSALPVLTREQAYQAFVNHLSPCEKEWLYLVNLGIKYPWVRYHNPHLSRSALGISRSKSIQIILKGTYLSAVLVLEHIKRRLKVMFTQRTEPTPS